MTETIHSKSAEAIEKARSDNRPALIGYLPAGYPTKEDSVQAILQLANNGVDIVEIGIPYSDPVMDGPVIQKSMADSLASGFKVSEVFDIIKEVTDQSDITILVMTYWNIVDRMGVENFARRLAEAGGAGIITPDLVPEEADAWVAASDKYSLDRIFLTAPSSTLDRVQKISDISRGFVYGVSVMGVTGARDKVSDAAQRVVAEAHAAGAPRVCVGLGVSKPEHVREIGAYADGVIVGTALVRALNEGGPEKVGQIAAELSSAYA